MKQGYQELKQQLDDIVRKLQDDELDVDEALKLYKTGQKTVAALEAYLKDAQLKVSEIKK